MLTCRCTVYLEWLWCPFKTGCISQGPTAITNILECSKQSIIEKPVELSKNFGPWMFTFCMSDQFHADLKMFD